VYKTGRPARLFNYEVIRKDGAKRIHENSISLIRDSEGRPVGFRGIVRDVTESVRNKEELDLQKAYFQQLFENSPEGIAILDGEDRFLDANRGFERLFQYSTEEIRGRSVNDLIVPGDLVDQARSLSLNAMDGKVVQTDSVRRRKDGSLVDVSIVAYPVSFGGRQAGIFVMYSDITDRKKAQHDLQAVNERLEAANEELIAAEEELKQQFADLQKRDQALRESENKFRQLFHNANDGIVLLDMDEGVDFGRYIEVNDIACKGLGYSREEFLSLTPLNVIAGENHYQLAALTRDFLSRGQITFETFCVTKNGQKIPFEISGHAFALNGRRVGLFVARDITERKLAEEKLRTAHKQLVDIIEFLPDPTFALDRDRKVIAWNRAMEEMTGVRKEQIIGMGNYAYSIPFYGEPRPTLVDLVFSQDREIELLYEKKIERKGNTLFTEVFTPALFEGRGAHIWVKSSPLFDSNGNVVGAIESIRDITDRKQAEEQLKFLSLHDPLTGLYNRAYFEEEMRRLESGRNHPVSIIVCDVDGLKLVNDTLGHQRGDDLLVAAADAIRESFREGDMIARIGGDEFAILLPNSDRNVVESACDRIRAAVEKYNAANPDLPLSMSLGSATSAAASVSPGDLFKEADNNMYREKLHRSQSARSATVQTLMKALEERDFITEGHAERLQNLVAILARSIGLHERRIADLRLLAQFHDIGKVGISDRILNKPGPLTIEEVIEMQRHCEIGHRIAQVAADMAHIADWILKHHEWWNGGGYPMGLKGEEIPLECRILAIVDAYDAMTSDRPYRKAMSHEQVVAEMKKYAGIQFDPQLVPVFIQVLHSQKILPDNKGDI
jgi:diguanylate cyclase (GGDEF)-like protein/PAS domain S-box-containing protein